MLYKRIEDCGDIIYFTEQSEIFFTKLENEDKIRTIVEQREANIGMQAIENKDTGKKLKKLIILLTSKCNLRCRYCYSNYGKYDGEEIIHNVDVETAKSAIEIILEKYPEGIRYIQFFGGEPLIAYSEMKIIYQFINKIMQERQLNTPYYGMVTNGLLINDDVIDFLNTSKIRVTVSIDGDQIIQDLVRKSMDEKGSYIILEDKMLRYRDKIKFNLFYEMTLNSEHVHKYKPGIVKDWLDSIKKLGFKQGIVGVVEFSKDPTLDFQKQDIIVLEQLYNEMVEYYFKELLKDKSRLYNIDINKLILIILRKEITNQYSCNTGISQLTLSSDGTFYPCPKFTDGSFRLGSVKEGVINNDVIKDVMISDEKADCQNCWMRNLCRSYCYSLKFRNKDGRQVIPIRCIHMSLLIENIVKNLARYKQAGELDRIVLTAQSFFKHLNNETLL